MSEVIIARNFDQANLTAQIDWGWMRYRHGARSGWINPETGGFVFFVGTADRLRGLPSDTVIHCAFGYFDSPAYRAAIGLVECKRASLGRDVENV
ncbi:MULTISPECIES: hypothetical protein [unclassified Thalassospira]|uniref:hypothetical protein n=1 Tax=unclassified Thalassospira TaxID=2648997 RepID=UPI0007A5FD38|nr:MULTISPECIES: hypothetical protein [unclassified Thalassospira]KZC99709.1 hypothetical protein AUQ41_08510 [Thalassospira sp. MCCC 1A02898]ONH85363.1 hypothetical protein TH47_05830 [Thalassospira sp. MCCC 1A02803]